MECGNQQQPNGDGRRQEAFLETPAYIERQRLRRLYQAITTYKHTRSDFLLQWAEDEVMHMVRDA